MLSEMGDELALSYTPMSTQPTVFIIDDDASVCRGVSNLLRSAGYYPKAFASAQEFLGHSGDKPDCIIVDLHMPETNGLELQETLAAQDYPPPIIFLTGYGDIPSTVTALKKGAVDFLKKPVDERVLLAAVDDALKKVHANREQLKEITQVKTRLASLTAREFEVLRHVIAGSLNKQIADALAISEKTVKVHRAHIMEKMAVRSVAELVRLTEKSDVRPIDSCTTKVQ